MYRTLCTVTLLALAMTSAVLAQETPKSEKPPTAEIFGGFSYLNYEVLSTNLPNGSVTETESCTGTNPILCQVTRTPTPTVNFTPRMGLYGWNGSVTADLTPWFGITTDFSGNYSNAADSITTTLTTTVSPCPANCTTTETSQLSVSNPTVYTFLFGPQFAYPAGKAKLYSRFLAGGEHKSVTESQTNTVNGTVLGEPASAATSGNYFAMAFGGGVDFPVRRNLSWRIGADYLTSTGTAQNHVRLSTGVVWRLGK